VVSAVAPASSGEYSRTSMVPNFVAASSRAWVSAAWSRTSAGNAAAVMPSAANSSTRPRSLVLSREMSATSKPCEPKVRAMARPIPGPAPTMAMLGMSDLS